MILAAGTGDRLGGSTPKAFIRLGDRPMMSFSIEAAAASGAVRALVVVVPASLGPDETAAIHGAGQGVPVEVVRGDSTRQGSVRRGLEAVPAGAGFVVVHDAARPFASPSLFGRVVAALTGEGDGRAPAGVVPVIPAADTVKRVRGGWVVATIAREDVALAQTPQAFVASALRQAHDHAVRAGLEGTDDAMLLEAAGFEVATVPGDASNFKITTREDLARAILLVAERPSVWTGVTDAADGGRPGPVTDGKVT